MAFTLVATPDPRRKRPQHLGKLLPSIGIKHTGKRETRVTGLFTPAFLPR